MLRPTTATGKETFFLTVQNYITFTRRQTQYIASTYKRNIQRVYNTIITGTSSVDKHYRFNKQLINTIYTVTVNSKFEHITFIQYMYIHS